MPSLEVRQGQTARKALSHKGRRKIGGASGGPSQARRFSRKKLPSPATSCWQPAWSLARSSILLLHDLASQSPSDPAQRAMALCPQRCKSARPEPCRAPIISIRHRCVLRGLVQGFLNVDLVDLCRIYRQNAQYRLRPDMIPIELRSSPVARSPDFPDDAACPMG